MQAAEITFIKAERAREAWEMDNYPEGEVAEMVELYKAKGVSEEDARSILSTMAKYKDVFVDHMVSVELGLEVPAEDVSPVRNGGVTFLSFVAFGSVPMWAYLIMWGAGYANANGMFGVACACTAATMFALGAVQARITRQAVIKAGMLMTLNGSLAAAAAYLVGWGLEHAIGNGQKAC